MTAYWQQWYLENDPMILHFSIRMNESRTCWQVRADGKHLMNCKTWADAIDTFYAFVRTEDPQAGASCLLFPTEVRII